MSHALPIQLTQAEQQWLFGLVRSTIERGLKGLPPLAGDELPQAPEGALREHLGAFVTLQLRGKLRGCMGLMRPILPLCQAVAAMARAAAFEDPRFMPLSAAEWPDVDFEISILGPSAPCPGTDRIELGRHGLMLEARGRTAVFLPRVPVEQGWSVRDTLEQLCRKASLPPDAWRDSTAIISWYEASVIHP
ncbi:MAG: AmmeMemoRadiSam system protein A [Desulfovibrionaceae bacterium]|nr:AmmeMemoRadiSam system protein A [Desulfovibrionaceae bacterium]